MTDLKEMIEREIAGFLDWPGDNKHIVTTVSAKLFAEHVARLYAESKPEPDASALVEALECARETIAFALRTSAPDYFTTDADIARHVDIQRIDTALAAYRKGDAS